MRTRRLIPVVLIVIASISQGANADAMRPDAEWAQGPGVVDRLELWLLNTIERVEVLFNLNSQPPPPAGGAGSGAPAVQRDCGSGIDPNGAGCKP